MSQASLIRVVVCQLGCGSCGGAECHPVRGLHVVGMMVVIVLSVSGKYMHASGFQWIWHGVMVTPWTARVERRDWRIVMRN